MSLVFRSLALAGTMILALPVVTLPAVAQNGPTVAPAPEGAPMTAEEFDAYTLGRTLSYAIQGSPYGIEEYLPGRRVRWTFVGDECQDGRWYERAGNICFIYDNAPDNEQCWRFYPTDRGMRAVFQSSEGPTTELYEVQEFNGPLACMGPGVGV